MATTDTAIILQHIIQLVHGLGDGTNYTGWGNAQRILGTSTGASATAASSAGRGTRWTG